MSTRTPLSGVLRTWHDDRGFGFIAPAGGGREVFVHISAFAQDGSRPAAGESVSYELGRGKDGKPQALRVQRLALRHAPPPSRGRAIGPQRRRSLLAPGLAIVLVAALGAYGYARYPRSAAPRAAQPMDSTSAAATAAAPPAAGMRCDGRQYCSQMTSCAEARFFLAHCPDTKMDGNHDGVPCEQQWCTGPFAR